MKKITLLVAIAAISLPSLAQQKDLTSGLVEYTKRDNPEKALIYFKKVEDKLKNGGSLSPKSMDKFHYNNGVINYKLAEKDSSITKVSTASTAFENCIKGGGKKAKSSKIYLTKVANLSTRLAYSYYDKKDYTNAGLLFDIAINSQEEYFPPVDDKSKKIFRDLKLYAAVNAKKAGDNKKALDLINQLIKEAPSESSYHTQKIELVKGTEAYLPALTDARKSCPTESYFVNSEINYYLQNNEQEKLLASLQEGIKLDANNPLLHFALGKTYQDMGKETESIASYDKAIELNPKDESAYINASSLYLNKANEVTEKMNELGYTPADQKKYSAYEKELTGLYKKALPYLKNCYEALGEDASKDVLSTLKKIYLNLEMEKEFEALNSK